MDTGRNFGEYKEILRTTLGIGRKFLTLLDAPSRMFLSQLNNGGGTLRKLRRSLENRPARPGGDRVGSSTDPRLEANGTQLTRMKFTRSAEARITISLNGRR